MLCLTSVFPSLLPGKLRPPVPFVLCVLLSQVIFLTLKIKSLLFIPPGSWIQSRK